MRENNKNLTLIFRGLETAHLGKDVFLVPYYLGKALKCEVNIVYPQTKTNKDFPSVIKGVNLIPIKFNKKLRWFPIWRTLPFYWYLFKNARNIDYLMRIHYSLHTCLQSLIYKGLNPKGKIYVKMDGLYGKEKIPSIITKSFCKKVDVISCESPKDFRDIMESKNIRYRFKDKFILVPNGFDEEEFLTTNIKEKMYKEKKNIFITVGRLGSVDKNTQMILNALDGIDMESWKFEFIGPIEGKLKQDIKEFFIKNPEKRDKVVFTGPIYEKRKLWEHYNDAKVFVLSSLKEGYPIVFGEAQRFKNFIISTDVGASKEVTCKGQYGHIIEINDVMGLRKEICDIISGKTNPDVYSSFDSSIHSWANILSKVTDKII